MLQHQARGTIIHQFSIAAAYSTGKIMSEDDPTKKPYHHGGLREALLATARTMIAEEGIESVTMRGLSQRVGVSRTAPYRHFEDKSSLLAAVAQQGFEQLNENLRQTRTNEQIESPLDRFEKMGVSYTQFAITNPTDYRLMYGVDALQSDEHPTLRQAINNTHQELVTIIRECKAAGLIQARSSLDIAVTVWSACHGLSLLLIDGHLPTVEASIASRVSAIVRAGLEAEG